MVRPPQQRYVKERDWKTLDESAGKRPTLQDGENAGKGPQGVLSKGQPAVLVHNDKVEVLVQLRQIKVQAAKRQALHTGPWEDIAGPASLIAQCLYVFEVNTVTASPAKRVTDEE